MESDADSRFTSELSSSRALRPRRATPPPASSSVEHDSPHGDGQCHAHQGAGGAARAPDRACNDAPPSLHERDLLCRSCTRISGCSAFGVSHSPARRSSTSISEAEGRSRARERPYRARACLRRMARLHAAGIDLECPRTNARSIIVLKSEKISTRTTPRRRCRASRSARSPPRDWCTGRCQRR